MSGDGDISSDTLGMWGSIIIYVCTMWRGTTLVWSNIDQLRWWSDGVGFEFLLKITIGTGSDIPVSLCDVIISCLPCFTMIRLFFIFPVYTCWVSCSIILCFDMTIDGCWIECIVSCGNYIILMSDPLVCLWEVVTLFKCEVVTR